MEQIPNPTGVGSNTAKGLLFSNIVSHKSLGTRRRPAKKDKRITIKLKPHESTNQRKSLTLVFEVQSHQIPRRFEAGYERGELTSQWTCAEKKKGEGKERTEYTLKLIIYHIKDPVVKYQKQEQQVREGNTRVTHV